MDPAAVTAKANALADEYGGTVRHSYHAALHGFSIETGEAEARRLAADPSVEYVEQDSRLQLDSTTVTPPQGAWGLDRIDERAGKMDLRYTYDLDGSGVSGAGRRAPCQR